MTKLKPFVRLDFMTVKPYLTAKNLLVYAAIILFFTLTSGDISSGIGFGTMIGILYIGYPFVVGEKCNMDALYPTLSVSRKTVVLGRYAYGLLFNLCAVVFSAVVTAAGTVGASFLGRETEIGHPLETVLVLSALFVVIQAIQLPMYFKLGYNKAKFLSIVPFAALMAGYMAFSTMSKTGGELAALLTAVLENGMTVPIAVWAVILVVLASYRLSLLFYSKREF